MSLQRTTLTDRRIRDDILTTLGLAALIHCNDRAVRETAVRLIPHAPGSMKKSLLRPLSESKEACAIVLEEIVYPSREKIIGTAYRDGYEYDIVLIQREEGRYEVEDVVTGVTEAFIKRGICRGRLYMTFQHPIRKLGDYTVSVDLDLAVQRSLQALQEGVVA